MVTYRSGVEEKKKRKITFFLKDDIKCPVCDTKFKREELFSGRGRLIAGGLTQELRRIYEPSKVYGKINPLIYPITVCPECYLAAMPEDFTRLKAKGVEKAKSLTPKRQAIIKRIFTEIDFTQPRVTRHGAASYILSIESYDYFDKWASPTVKKAISALRAGWLFSDLEVEDPMADFGNFQNLFIKKALQYYLEVLHKQERAEESFDGIKHLGPDTDVNYGYDGILFLVGSLSYKISFQEKHNAATIENLDKAKRVLSKMFGHGKSTKEKPSVIIDIARDLYEEIANKVKELHEQLERGELDTSATPQADPSGASDLPSAPAAAEGTVSQQPPGTAPVVPPGAPQEGHQETQIPVAPAVPVSPVAPPEGHQETAPAVPVSPVAPPEGHQETAPAVPVAPVAPPEGHQETAPAVPVAPVAPTAPAAPVAAPAVPVAPPVAAPVAPPAGAPVTPAVAPVTAIPVVPSSVTPPVQPLGATPVVPPGATPVVPPGATPVVPPPPPAGQTPE